MQETALPLSGRLFGTLELLARRPTLLWAIALALNALVAPYLGLFQDAILYSFFVRNRIEGGAFASDLFLRYGSQDRFSVFSAAVAPLAAVLGLPAVFF